MQEGRDVQGVASEQKVEGAGTKMMLSLMGNYGKNSRRKRCEKKFRERYVDEEDRED